MMDKVKQNLFVKGWNYGNIRVTKEEIEFECSDQSWINIPYSEVSNVITPAKNDLNIEFNVEDSDPNNRDDILCDIRLFIPSMNNEAENEEKEDGMDVDEGGKAPDSNVHNADNLREEIQKYANIGTLGDAYVILTEMPMITPRGRFDVQMLKGNLKIHGPSHDYKITYKNIMKVFLLPRQDGIHIDLVVKLDKPLKQGNTTYQYLIFQCKKDNEKTIELNLPQDKKERDQILHENLEDSISGPIYDIMARLIKSFVGIGVIIPGNFKNSKNLSSIKCVVKSNEGYLYPLEKSLIFIHKPVIFVGLDTINHVEFSRMGNSSMQRSFDMIVHLNNEEGDHKFTNIDKPEYDLIIKYFSTKKIKVKNESSGTAKLLEVDETRAPAKKRQAPTELEPELPDDDEDYDFDDDSGSSVGGEDEDDDEGSAKKKKHKKDKKKKHKKDKKKKKMKSDVKEENDEEGSS